jgi:Fe-S-cluster containining protein
MNVPAIAKRTFEELRNQNDFMAIVHSILDTLRKITGPTERAELIHKEVDSYNHEVFAHPLVKQFSPCKMGCEGCCHTQVSVTDDEAALLVLKINEGASFSQERLALQMAAENNSEAYYKLSYADRRCIFLDEQGACNVYEHRPSVCRTNAVLGEASQCDTSVSIKPTRLIKTPKSDMVIYASFLFSKSSGTLPFMISKAIKEKKSADSKVS